MWAPSSRRPPAYPGPEYHARFPGFVWLELVVFACAFVTGLISIAYETFATVRYGRTLGKRWLGIRPVRADGSPITTGRALGRSAFRAGVGFLSWIGLLDPLWCLWDDTRQCLHDKVADTIVINDPSPHDGAPVTPYAALGYGSNYDAWAPVPGVPKTNLFAIASLACSVGGFLSFGVAAIPGVVFGFVSRRQIRRSSGSQTGAGLALGGIVVGFAVLALMALFISVLVVLAPTNSSGSSYESPPPGFVTHPLTHKVTVLPAWMSSSDPEPDGRVNLPLEYRVVAALWTARQDALAELDPQQIAVVDQPGSEALAADRALITLSSEGGQLSGPLRAQPESDWIAVPSSASSYPLTLLGEVASPGSKGEEQVTLLVITKRSTTTPWRVTFTTDYSTKGSAPSYLLPTLNVPTVPIPPASVPGLLASYWQTWVDDHHAPVDSPFDPGYWTTTLGAQIGSRTTGALFHGTINSVSVRVRAGLRALGLRRPGRAPDRVHRDRSHRHLRRHGLNRSVPGPLPPVLGRSVGAGAVPPHRRHERPSLVCARGDRVPICRSSVVISSTSPVVAPEVSATTRDLVRID